MEHDGEIRNCTPCAASEAEEGSNSTATPEVNSHNDNFSSLAKQIDSSLAIQHEIIAHADNVIRKRNEDLVEPYKKIGSPMKETTKVFIEDEQLKKYPTLNTFNIPLIPVLLRKLVKDLVNFARDCLDEDFLTSIEYDGGHKHVIMSILKPKNFRSFSKYCKPILKDLPAKMVKDSMYKGLNDVEKEAARLKDIRDIRKWCIESLLEDDTVMHDVLRDIAKKKLGMFEKKRMSAADIGAMLKLFNVMPTTFRGMKSFMETFWEFRMFDSKDSVRLLYQDAVVPITGETTDELKIRYWYKEFKDVLILFLRDHGQLDLPLIMDAMKRIHIVFASDHGKEKSRSAIKILLMDADRDDSQVLKWGVASVGNIDHTKDDYKTLKDTIFPHFDRMI